MAREGESDERPFAVFDVLEGAEVRLFLSPRIRSEIEDVLTRPVLRAKYPQLTVI